MRQFYIIFGCERECFNKKMKKYIKLSFVLYLKRIKSVKRKVEMR